MKPLEKLFLLGVAIAVTGKNATAQVQPPEDDRPPVISRDTMPNTSQKSEDDLRNSAPANGPTQPADGSRHGLPLEVFAVVPGTHVLVRLEDELSTADPKNNFKFKVRTMEPMEAGSGFYLPAGAEIRAHVSRVEPANITGRAKLWLVFDEIKTRFGVLPIVADVVDVPGDHSVKTGPGTEGMIEGKKTTQQAAGEAAAEGAAMGAVRGVKDKNAKEAVTKAAESALAAYLMESGRGHEIVLPKGTKLELELERALYLVKE
jgi:Mor family transcriptional regulator